MQTTPLFTAPTTDLPAGHEALVLVRCSHPDHDAITRVDLVGAGWLPAHRAEVSALGFTVERERPVGVQPSVPLSFPRDAIASHATHVAELLALEAAIEAQVPVLSSKPGRAESALHALVPQVKAIEPTLVPPFLDHLIDRYLSVGNGHYANRQAKAALAAWGTSVPSGWAHTRALTVLEAGFFPQLLWDTAVASGSLDVHLGLFDALLTHHVVPNKGIVGKLRKAVKAGKAQDRLDALLLRHVGNTMLLVERGHAEVVRIRDAALAVLDAQPAEIVVATLSELAEALRVDGDVASKVTLQEILEARVAAHPALQRPLGRLCIRLCKNITFGYGDRKRAVDESAREAVTTALVALDPGVLESLLDHWAEEVADYEPWAKKWLRDTTLTILDVAQEHAAVLRHEGLVAAVLGRLIDGAGTHGERDSFVDTLCQWLVLLPDAPIDPVAMATLVDRCLVEGWSDELERILVAAAAHPSDLQAVWLALVDLVLERGCAGLTLLELLSERAAWIETPTRSTITERFAATEARTWLVQAALDQGWTLTDLQPWMDLSARGPRITKRHDLVFLTEHEGHRWSITGKGRHDSVFLVFCDDACVAELEEDTHSLEAATVTFDDEAPELRTLHNERYEDRWQLRRAPVGADAHTIVELGSFGRVLFDPRHARLIGLTRDTATVLDLDGTELARHELTLQSTGDWDDWYQAVHPLRDAVGLCGPDETLLLGADPTAPQRIPRGADGFVREGGELLLLCRVDDRTCELVRPSGTVVRRVARVPGGYYPSWGSSGTLSRRQWIATDVRGGADDELLLREQYAYQPLQTVDGREAGRVTTDFGQERFADVRVLDLNGDGLDEVYVFDFMTPRIGRVSDPAAATRRTLLRRRDELLGAGSLGPVGQGGLSLDSVGGPLGEPVFAPALARLAQVDAAIHTLITEAFATPVALPEAPQAGPSLSAAALKRLKETHFGYRIDGYPFERAMQDGSIDGYLERLVRGETGALESAYLRRLIEAHLQVARETGLPEGIRDRALDLTELLLDLSASDEVRVALSVDWGSRTTKPELYAWRDPAGIEAVAEIRQHGRVPDDTLERLHRVTDELGLDRMAWSVEPCHSIYDYDFVAVGDLGDATLRLRLMLDEDGSNMADEPLVWGTPAQVAAVRDRLMAMVDQTDPRAPGHVDEWMTDAERTSLRGEVAALRAADTDGTTVGRSAHASTLATLAERLGVKEDTAAVLAAMVVQRHADRDDIETWAGVKRSSILGHLKKLAALGHVDKDGRDWSLAHPTFQERFFNEPPSAYDSSFRGKRMRCFSEADVLAAWMAGVG